MLTFIEKRSIHHFVYAVWDAAYLFRDQWTHVTCKIHIHHFKTQPAVGALRNCKKHAKLPDNGRSCNMSMDVRENFHRVPLKGMRIFGVWSHERKEMSRVLEDLWLQFLDSTHIDATRASTLSFAMTCHLTPDIHATTENLRYMCFKLCTSLYRQDIHHGLTRWCTWHTESCLACIPKLFVVLVETQILKWGVWRRWATSHVD